MQVCADGYELYIERGEGKRNNPLRRKRLGCIFCWSALGYGDKHKYASRQDFLFDLVCKTVAPSAILTKARNGGFESVKLDFGKKGVCQYTETGWYLSTCSDAGMQSHYLGDISLSRAEDEVKVASLVVRSLSYSDLRILANKNCYVLDLYYKRTYGDVSLVVRESPFLEYNADHMGYIFVTFDDAKKALGKKCAPSSMKQEVQKILNAEMQLYAHFLYGDCYDYGLLKDGDVIKERKDIVGSDKAVTQCIAKDVSKFSPELAKKVMELKPSYI